MTEIEISGIDFGRIMRACARAASKNDIRAQLRYIELRANGTQLVATALDGFVMQQIKIPCNGRGVVLIPSTVKPEKCEKVLISENECLRISFYNSENQLIIAYEYPKITEKYIDWQRIVKEEKRAESIIHVDAKYLRRIVMATAHAEDQIFSISIPDDKKENIRLASNDAQAIVMPMNILHEQNYRRFENWYELAE